MKLQQFMDLFILEAETQTSQLWHNHSGAPESGITSSCDSASLPRSGGYISLKPRLGIPPNCSPDEKLIEIGDSNPMELGYPISKYLHDEG